MRKTYITSCNTAYTRYYHQDAHFFPPFKIPLQFLLNNYLSLLKSSCYYIYKTKYSITLEIFGETWPCPFIPSRCYKYNEIEQTHAFCSLHFYFLVSHYLQILPFLQWQTQLLTASMHKHKAQRGRKTQQEQSLFGYIIASFLYRFCYDQITFSWLWRFFFKFSCSQVCLQRLVILRRNSNYTWNVNSKLKHHKQQLKVVEIQNYKVMMGTIFWFIIYSKCNKIRLKTRTWNS